MTLLLCDLDGREHRLGVAGGRFVSPEATGDDTQDLRYLYAMTGLADCHVHLTGVGVQEMIDDTTDDPVPLMRRHARLQLESGVLLLADKGSKTSLSLRFLDEEETNRPHLQMAGRMISVPNGYYPGFCEEIDGGNLAEVIGNAVGGGARWVKLVGDWPRRGRGPVSNFTEAELIEVVRIAHDAGCRVAIHTTAPDTASMAVRAGVDSIEHGLYLTEDDLVQLGERGGAWVPTILAMENIANWLGPESSGGRAFSDGLANVRALLGQAVEAGVAVLAGTDVAVPHGAVAREATRLVEYGLSPAAAVRAISGAAWDYLGVEAGLDVGKPADLVLFETNPLHDITELQRPAHVMRAGRVVFSSL